MERILRFKWVWLDNKNSLKHYENSLIQIALTVIGLYSGGLIIGRIFAPEIWGAYFREGLFLFIHLFIYLFYYYYFGGGGLGGGACYRNFTVYILHVLFVFCMV